MRLVLAVGRPVRVPALAVLSLLAALFAAAIHVAVFAGGSANKRRSRVPAAGRGHQW